MVKKVYFKPLIKLLMVHIDDILTGSKDDEPLEKDENKEYWTGNF